MPSGIARPTPRRVATLTLIAAAIAIGAWLRFDGLGVPSYWLDEILGQRFAASAAALAWWRWLIGFAPDQGPLYFATQLVGNEFVGRLLPALFGVATIAVLACSRVHDRLVAAAAAMMLALSPLHVYYSREARPYALMMLLTAIAIALLLRETNREWPIVTVMIALLYTHAAAAPIVASIAIVALLTRRIRLSIVAIAIAGLFMLFYRGGPNATPHAPFPADILATIARALTVSALTDDVRDRAVIAMLMLAAIGAIALWRRNRTQALIVTGMTVLPIALAVLSIRIVGHWFAARYVSAGVIGFVMLVAAGIVTMATFIGRREWIATPLALLVIAILAREMLPAARTEPFRKLDWRGIAATLRENARPGDVVLAAEPWSEVSLRYYLGNTMPVIEVPNIDLANMLVLRKRGTWLVSAGYSNGDSVRLWMCRFPLVMSSALESFRLHYAGSQRELLQRATPPTLRAVAASFRTLTANDDLLFGDGWASTEGAFRWAAAKQATVFLPRFGHRDGVITMYVLPMPPQSMRVSLNGHVLSELALVNDWTEYAIKAPASTWIDGLNTLTFDFAHPASPGVTDSRTLAACFTFIAVDDSKPADRPLIPSMRIDSNRFLDSHSVWRNARTRFPAAQLHRRNVEALLGRLGFDPLTTWPKLASGEVHLDDVVETVAYGSDCDDDRVFLAHAFATLLERRPNDIEERDLLARLRNGATREVIVGRIVKSGDFRALALSFAPR